jgi:hypothetical protein
MLSKSLGCYISSGTSSAYIDSALESALNSVEAMVRGGWFLGGKCHKKVKTLRLLRIHEFRSGGVRSYLNQARHADRAWVNSTEAQPCRE